MTRQLLTIEDLKKHNGEHVKILGKEFTFFVDSDLGGDWCVFGNDFCSIYATLNLECIGVPISIRDKDGVDNVGDTCYLGTVVDWKHYLMIVETFVYGELSIHKPEFAWWTQ